MEENIKEDKIPISKEDWELITEFSRKTGLEVKLSSYGRVTVENRLFFSIQSMLDFYEI